MIYFQHSDMSNESPIEQNEPEMQGDVLNSHFKPVMTANTMSLKKSLKVCNKSTETSVLRSTLIEG